MSERTELIKKGNRTKATLAVAAVGTVAAFIFLHWIVGLAGIILCCAVFWSLIKNYAATGKRF